MNLLKFSKLRKHINSNGVMNILIDKDTILKISFPELLISCGESLNLLAGEIKLNLVGEIIGKILSSMSISPEVIENMKKVLEISSVEEIPLTARESELIGFVSLLVNEESPMNTISMEELSQVVPNLEIQDAIEILNRNGYLAVQRETKLEIMLVKV